MKKTLSLLLTALLAVCLLAPMTVSAAAASGSLSGPGTVRAGDSIQLTFYLNGKGLSGASGSLSYDKNQLELVSVKQAVAAPWMVEFNGGRFVAYDNALTAPIQQKTALFTASFRVKSNVKPGEKITVSVQDAVATDGAVDQELGAVLYAQTVLAPLSSDNLLTGLLVVGADLKPAFKPSVTHYAISVPHAVSRLEIKAGCAKGAKISVHHPALRAGGETDVTLSVQAENGAVKVYTITVSRGKDPNYQPSDNCKLSALRVEQFLLSPAFDPGQTEYAVWVPYETESVTVRGTADDRRADVNVDGGTNLQPGTGNRVLISCNAEDGTEKIYTVTVYRAPRPGESWAGAPEESSSLLEEESETEAEKQPSEKQSLPLWLLIVIGVAALGAGFGIGIPVGRKTKRS